MTRESYLRIIQQNFGHVKTSPYSDEINVNCPFCKLRGLTPNTTYKLGINIAKGKFHCFRCDYGGILQTLIPQIEVIDKPIVVESVIEDDALENMPECQRLDQLSYPWVTLVNNFLHSKNFSPFNLLLKVLFCQNYIKKGYSFGPRLIFPIYQSGTYRGFQGRTIYKNTDPKYIGASNMDRRTIIYNYDIAFAQSERLVITEGFLDQIRTGDTAIATLGKIITKEQLRLIKLGNFKKVIVFLDDDARKESYANAKKLSSRFSTYVARPTKKDPGEMTRDEIEYVFENKLERIY